MKTYVVDGVTLVKGENAKENFAIIDAAREDDIWVHHRDLPSCHVVIACSAPSKEVLLAAGRLCCGAAKHAQHAQHATGKANYVIWAPIRNVNKTKMMGMVTVDGATSLYVPRLDTKGE